MRKLIVTLSLLTACTDTSNTSIEIPFALFAGDEIGVATPGICSILPATSGALPFKESGLLELNPQVNPGAQYLLPLQVENYLSQVPLQDSLGNTLVGANVNDFHVEKAVIKYIDIQGNLGVGGNAPAEETALVSGTVRTGGLQAAAVIEVNAVTPYEVGPWAAALVAGGVLGVAEDVVLEIQLFGVLGSGEQAVSGLFHFPIQVCYNCGGATFVELGADGGTPYWLPSCPPSSTAIVTGHGPCCASQDFEVICAPAGGATGQPCVGGVGGTCSSSAGTSTPLTCKGGPPTGVEICNSIPASIQQVVTCQ